MPVTNFDKNTRKPPAVSIAHGVTAALLASAFLNPVFAVAQPLTDSPEPMGFYGFNDEIPEVLTTTRLRQPKTRVPRTTTVIEGEMIRDLGIMSLVEVFRLVPEIGRASCRERV